MKSVLPHVVLTILLFGCRTSPAPRAVSGGAASQVASAEATLQHPREASIGGYRYLTFVTGNAKPGDRLPMIVGLHYSSAKPETIIGDFAGIDFPARIVLPQGRYPRRSGYSWFPSEYEKLAAPAQKTITFDILHEMSTFIDSASKQYSTRGKPVVVGISYGGDLSFLLAIHHPDRVQAAFPVASRFLPEWMPSASRCTTDCPLVFVMHGTQDKTVPMEPTRDAARRLAGLGMRVEFHEYAGVEHDYPDGMKADFVAAARRILSDPAP